MNEYWLMLLVVGLAAALAWAFFLHLARLVIWGSRPTLDAWRYGLITVCLVIEIGNAFEAWEAALLCAISVLAYCVIRRERNRFESAMQELKARAHRFPGESSAHRY